LQVLTLSLLSAGVSNPARMAERIHERGYDEVTDIRFNWMSGNLYQDAVRLADLCREAGDERAGILARNGGKHPHENSLDWPRWIDRTLTMNACAVGARMIAAASVEALVNEILTVRFHDSFLTLEGETSTKKGKRPSRAGFPARLKKLAELAGFDHEAEWAQSLARERDTRHGLAHAKASYVYD